MNKLSIFTNMTQSNIEFDKVKQLDFKEKVEWLNNYLEQDDTSDEYDGFIVQLIFSTEESILTR